MGGSFLILVKDGSEFNKNSGLLPGTLSRRKYKRSLDSSVEKRWLNRPIVSELPSSTTPPERRL